MSATLTAEATAMKVQISRPELVQLIGKLQSIVSAKPAIPILANILLEAYDDQLVISATDLTVSMRAFMDAKVRQEGSITLPARRFFQLIRELTTPQVEISCTTQEVATIIAGTSRFRLNGMHKSEFPALPDFSSATHFSLPSLTLKEMLGKTAFAAAREDARQVLNGVLMQTHDVTCTFIGTDGKRLAKVHTELDTSLERCDYLIPLKAVEEMVKSLDSDEIVKMSLQNDKIALDIGSVCVMTKLLSGQYPNVDRVIPKDTSTLLHLHREELITLLKQVSLFTSDKSQSVHFIFTKGELHLVGTSSEIGEGKVNMPVDYTGDKLEIAFNPAFFLDILRHSSDETVKFALTDSYNPGMITDSSTASFVIMPMRLSP